MMVKKQSQLLQNADAIGHFLNNEIIPIYF